MNWHDFLSGRPTPAVMGILNVTPDSFSDGGEFFTLERAVAHGRRMAEEGADLIDIGGESTRPAGYGPAEEVMPEEEIRRVVPVIERLRAGLRIPLSVDTRKSPVARAALAAGASIVNDVSAMRFDPEMPQTAAGAGAAVILMHMRGTDPARMQEGIAPGDPFPDVLDSLRRALGVARQAGIPGDRIAVDPGLGFGKTPEQNLALLSGISRLSGLGHTVAVGASRKGFVRRYSGVAETAAAPERLPGSLACAAVAADRGAGIVRVHDVGPTVRFLASGRRSGDWSAAAREVGAAGEPFQRMLDALLAAGLPTG